MADSIPTRMRLSASDKEALLEYWRFIEPIANDVNEDLRRSLLDLPEWAPLVHAMSPERDA